MEMIRRYFEQIKAQLNGLSISQKLLIGLLAVVMVATIFFTVVFSAKPAMVPLIAQPMSAADINKAEMELKALKYEYQVSNDKILIPVDEAYAIRGALAAKQALPKDLSSAFARVAMDSNPFQTEGTKERQWNNAKQEELTLWLQNFPNVENGSVIIALGQRMGLGTPALPSTATVNVKLKGNDPLSSNQLLAIVEMVTGAVSGMKRENVHVVDGLRAYHAPSEDTPIPSDMIQYKKLIEDDLTQKLYRMFEHCGDVKIAVNAVPDLSVRVRRTEKFDPKNTIVKPLTETVHETNSSTGSAPEGQPGVPPNTGMQVADNTSNNRKQTATSNDTSTSNMIKVGSVIENQTLPAGVEIKELTASLSLPRSFFVSIWRHGKDANAEPDDAALEPVMIKELKRAVAQAKNAIGAKTDDQIQVDYFDDSILLKRNELVLAATGLASGNIGAMVAAYAKQGVLAVVALGALGMMLMMVKRAVPAADAADVDTAMFLGGKKGKGKRRNQEVDQLNAGDDVFGEANEGNAVLTGIELDDDTLQSRKMVDEVSTMIKENPENAATLVKRWMTKSK